METEMKTDQITQQISEYVNLRTDAFKLKMAEDLSTTLSSMFGVLLFVLLVTVAGLFFTTALTLWLAMLIGSLTWALVIMGALLLIASAVVFVRRDRLITDALVAMFCRKFFSPKE